MKSASALLSSCPGRRRMAKQIIGDGCEVGGVDGDPAWSREEDPSKSGRDGGTGML